MYKFWQIHRTNHRNPLINFDKSKPREFHETNLTNPIWTKFNKSTDWLSDTLTKKRQLSNLGPIKKGNQKRKKNPAAVVGGCDYWFKKGEKKRRKKN